MLLPWAVLLQLYLPENMGADAGSRGSLTHQQGTERHIYIRYNHEETISWPRPPLLSVAYISCVLVSQSSYDMHTDAVHVHYLSVILPTHGNLLCPPLSTPGGSGKRGCAFGSYAGEAASRTPAPR